jgi:hypothetical protein
MSIQLLFTGRFATLWWENLFNRADCVVRRLLETRLT